MDMEVLGQVLGFQGMNTDMIEERLPPEDEPYFITNGENILIKNGKIEKLRGTDFLNNITTQQGITGYRTILGFSIFRTSAPAKYLVAATPQRFYYLKTDNQWDNLGTITNGGNDSLFSCGEMLDKFIFTVSGSTFVWSWDGGASIAKLFTPPMDDNMRARCLLTFKGFLFLLRTIETTTEWPRRIRWSNAFVPGTFDDEDRLDIEGKGEILNGKQLEDEIIIYFDKSIHRVAFKSLDEEEGFFPTAIAGADGLLAAKTLCGDDDAHFYLASKGLMRFIRGDLPRSVSDKKFNKLVLDQIDPVYYYRAVAQYYPHLNLLFLAYPKSGSTYNDTQIIFDTSVNELVSKKTLMGENYSAYGTFEKDLSGLSPDERKAWGLSFIPIFGNADGFIKEQLINEYQDGISNYQTSITLPGSFWKSRDLNKRCLAIDLLIEKLTNENITFTVKLANEMNETYAFNYTITGNGNAGIRRYQLRSDDNGVGVDCFGKQFKVEIADSNCYYGWKFHGALFYGDYLGQK